MKAKVTAFSETLLNGISSQYLNIHDRSIHYGDGLFETILSTDGKLYYWAQHYQRLRQSASRLQLFCPPEEMLLADIEQLLASAKTNNNHCCAIKIIITRGSGQRGYVFPAGNSTNRLVSVTAIEKEYSSLLSGQLDSGELFVCKQQVSINESLAGIKHLNRLENVLARNEFNHTAKECYIDGLMLDARQCVIEATMSNVFAVKGGQLITPDLSQSGVKGIMRDVIIWAAENNNIKVSYKNVSLDDMLQMDEIFITNSLIGIKSVNKIKTISFDKSEITRTIFNIVFGALIENV